MKIKLLTICLFLFTSQVFAKECKGDYWDNCISVIDTVEKIEETDTTEIWASEKNEGRYEGGLEQGLFTSRFEEKIIHKNIIVDGKHFSTSNSGFSTGNMKDGVPTGLWGYCTTSNNRHKQYNYFEIGNYSKHGVRDGVWGRFYYETTSFDGSFEKTGCHKKTVELFLDKENLCSQKKNSHFKNFETYLNGEIVSYFDKLSCRGPSEFIKGWMDYISTIDEEKLYCKDTPCKKPSNTDPEYAEWIKNFE